MLLFHGSGAEPFRADLLIDGNRIAQIGDIRSPADCEIVECGGLAVAPGFIDLNSHADLPVLEEERIKKVRQGVTTEVVGS